MAQKLILVALSACLISGIVPFQSGSPFLASAVAQQEGTAAADPRGAMEFIDQMAKNVLVVWSDQQMTASEREAAFRKVFKEATDIRLLSQAMLGRYYRTATKDQRQAYMAAMTEYIITEFNKRMTQIGFREVTVIGTTPASGRRGHLYVKTEVDREEGGPLLADWRVRKKNGKFQIVNLEIEGINLVITNREYFASRIKELGGLDGLIAELEADYVKTDVPDAVKQTVAVDEGRD